MTLLVMLFFFFILSVFEQQFDMFNFIHLFLSRYTKRNFSQLAAEPFNYSCMTVCFNVSETEICNI